MTSKPYNRCSSCPGSTCRSIPALSPGLLRHRRHTSLHWCSAVPPSCSLAGFCHLLWTGLDKLVFGKVPTATFTSYFSSFFQRGTQWYPCALTSAFRDRSLSSTCVLGNQRDGIPLCIFDTESSPLGTLVLCALSIDRASNTGIPACSRCRTRISDIRLFARALTAHLLSSKRWMSQDYLFYICAGIHKIQRHCELWGWPLRSNLLHSVCF